MTSLDSRLDGSKYDITPCQWATIQRVLATGYCTTYKANLDFFIFVVATELWTKVVHSFNFDGLVVSRQFQNRTNF